MALLNDPQDTTHLVPVLFVGSMRSGTGIAEYASSPNCSECPADGSSPVASIPLGTAVGNHAAPGRGKSK